jgi:hypothetical protein
MTIFNSYVSLPINLSIPMIRKIGVNELGLLIIDSLSVQISQINSDHYVTSLSQPIFNH